MRYTRLARTPVPQHEPLDSRQVKNNAGGYVYQLDDWARLNRFLILGSDSSTYYQKAPQLTRENSACVTRCYDADPEKTVNTIVEVSQSGRAAKNDSAVFALAIGAAHANVKARQLATANMFKVCRTYTHLAQFVGAAKALGRGWGETMTRAVADWYDKKEINKVAFQAIKYRDREGYAQKDILKLAHPRGDDSPERVALYRWICGKEHKVADLPPIVQAHILAMATNSKKELYGLVEKYKLPWEALPTSALNDPKVWEIMLPDMGLTALIRELARMTQIELLKPLSTEVGTVIKRLTDLEQLRAARIHPFNVLNAAATYKQGRGFKGSRTWTPVPAIVDALEEAFYLSFKTIEPSEKRTLLAMDVSGSMTSPLMNSALSVREASMAMAMTTMRSEKNWHVMAFSNSFVPLDITAKQSLDTILRKTANLPFSGTDCSLPMVYAMKNRLEVDVFAVYTDNETWAGRIHPMQALRDYRRHSGINAKLVVAGMTSTGFSIADPNDAGSLDVVGFDSNAPSIIADFARGS